MQQPSVLDLDRFITDLQDPNPQKREPANNFLEQFPKQQPDLYTKLILTIPTSTQSPNVCNVFFFTFIVNLPYAFL